MLVETRGIGHHAAEEVVGVGKGHRAVEAGSIHVGDCVVVDSATDVAEAEVVGGQTDAGGLVAEGARCHTQQRREAEAAAYHIVHLHTVDIHCLILRVIAAVAEVHRAEIV